MDPLKKNARLAGFLYLLLIIVAPFGLYIPSKLIVEGNATATANNIIAHEFLFRLGIVVGLASSVIFIFVVLALYRLLKPVDPKHAALMAVLALVSVPIGFLNDLNYVAALLLVRGGDYLSVFEKPQRDAMAMLFLRVHYQGIVAVEIFWGLWLFPLAILVYRSRFLPRFIGVWLMVNCFAYLALSITGILFPQSSSIVMKAALPAQLGELALMLWLLIRGAKPPALEATVVAAESR
jgi:hypothetical protein